MATDWFSGIEEVISDDLRFKNRLRIGSAAYTSLTARDAIFDLWDAVGAAGVGAKLAGSSAVAGTLFGSTSVLTTFGIGAAASTPIGWVAAAALLSGAGWIGISRYLKSDSGKVDVIPKFINTPIDILGLSLFDLMCPLSLKVASVDGVIHDAERQLIRKHFVKEWGYSEAFVIQGMKFIEEKIYDLNIKDVAQAFAVFARQNRDCNHKEMTNDVIAHLKEVMAADGVLNELEELVIEKMQNIFITEYSKIFPTGSMKPATQPEPVSDSQDQRIENKNSESTFQKISQKFMKNIRVFRKLGEGS